MKENRGFGSKSMSKGIATSAAVLLLLCIAAAAMVPTASAGGWDYYRVITIDNNQVSGSSDLSSFPVLINHTADWLKYNDSGDHVQQADGCDIVFTNADNTTLLDYEIEEYNGTAGTLVAWVRIPSLSGSKNTTIRLWYGNPNAADWSNATGVWDDDYKAVWHLLGDGTTSLPDATSNSNTGTKTAAGEPANTAGPIDGAQVFDGDNDKVDCGHGTGLNVTRPLTIEAWINPSSVPSGSTAEPIVFRDDGSRMNYALTIASGSYTDNTGVKVLFWREAEDDADFKICGTTEIEIGNWYHIVAVDEGTQGAAGDFKIYVNGGSAEGTASQTLTAYDDVDYKLIIGDTNGETIGSGHFFPGTIDEVRISATTRSEDWIQTEYTNQHSPGTFYSVGDSTPAPEGTNPTPDPSALVLFAAGITMLTVFFGWRNKRKGL